MSYFIDFVNNYAPLIWLSLEILAALTGLIVYKKYKHTVNKYFIWFLVYIVFMAIIGRYTYWVVGNGSLRFLQGTVLEQNYWWFTIFWNVASVLFFGWYYLKLLNNVLSKKILKISLVAFLLISVFSILITLPKFFYGNMNIIEISGTLIILQCVFYYFFEVLQSDKILDFYKSLAFYISCAVLILWLVQTPLTFFEMYNKTYDMDYVNLRNYINLLVISFMYITYTVGLIVSKPEYD